MTNVVTTKAGRFLVFPNDALGKVLQTKGDFEPHFLQIVGNVVRPGDLCIDLGANLGYHSVTLAQLTGPSGLVLAFEPQRIIFQQLCGNAFLNNLRNVRTFNAAVGAQDGMIQMDAVDYDDGQVNIGCTKVGSGGDTAQMIRLDALKLQGVKFIKVDIQGCEELFLDGATATLAKSRPVMFVEIEEYLLRCFGSSSERLMNRLLAMNYVLVRILNDYPCDHLAVPAEQAHLIPHYLKDVPCPHAVIQGRAVRVRMDHPTHTGAIYGTCEVLPLTGEPGFGPAKNGKMNITLSNERLDAMDLNAITTVPPFNRPYFRLPSGQEHYRLLIHLTHCLENITIADVGTNRGASALALAQNQKNRIVSFDIVDVKENDLGVKNIDFCLGDFRTDDNIQRAILASAVIFLDVDHLYANEIWIYRFLAEKGWQGPLFCDDIHLNEHMKRFWNEVTHPKIDLTKYGHGSGTGCIFFGDAINFHLV